MTKLLILSLLALPMFGQQQDHYTASATTTALTLQAPTSNARQISFPDQQAGVFIYCAAAQTATLSWNGAAATATAGSEVKLPGTNQPSGLNIFTASNVGSGTTGPVYNVPAGGTFPVWLGFIRMGTGGNTTNLTISTSGTCTITFVFSAV